MSEMTKADPDIASSERERPSRRATIARLRAQMFKRRIELSSAALMAVATIATAWCGYQSARWNGERADHAALASMAGVRTAKFTNLVGQKISFHAQLFAQWASAISAKNTALADFLLQRFPEPLKTATTAWQATNPLTNPEAPPTPLSMPEYALTETTEAALSEETALKEYDLANRADDMADRYLIFTIIYASVLFFAGISGKFGWQALDVTMLVVAGLALLIGLLIMFTIPVA